MLSLPVFPVDDATLDLIDAAVNGVPGPGGRSSVTELCNLMSELAGSDIGAVERIVEEADPARGGLAGAEVVVMRDPVYHPNSIIAALVAEVRRLRREAVS
jgi:hypothetical protein